MEAKTPFAKHLDTNYVPSDEELPLIRALIQQKAETLAVLNARIKALEVERDAEQSFVQRHIALISPIKRVPDDILSSLFIAFSALRRNRYEPWPTGHPAVILSHVCSHWRQLALGTPVLWSTLKVYIPPLPSPVGHPMGLVHMSSLIQRTVESEATHSWEKQVDRLLRLSRVWIGRSKDCFLTIDFLAADISPSAPDSTISTISSIIGVICDASWRWKWASLYLPSRTPINSLALGRLYDLKPADIPSLCDLALSQSTPFFGSSAPISPPDTGILGGGAIRTLSFTFQSFPTLNTLPIKWAQLTKLVFDGNTGLYYHHHAQGGYGGVQFNCASALGLMRRCPQLAHCDISFGHHAYDLHAAIESVTLPYLQFLCFRLYIPGKHFISSLHLPALQALSFRSFHDSSMRTAGPHSSRLVVWLQTYGQQITDVEFNVETLSQSSLYACMDLLTNLTSLRLDHNGNTSRTPPGPPWDAANEAVTPAKLDGDFLHRLTPRDDSGNTGVEVPVWCPRLETIRFPKEFGSVTFSEVELAKFIAGRRLDRNGKGLREVIAVLGTLKGQLDVKGHLDEMGVDLNGVGIKVFYASPFLVRPPSPMRYPETDYDHLYTE
ncbi:hypothetical protein DFP72DRAFT_425776 [Ephemerocybe angulata]|uniref:F-box domain-containing protein n=1 Tax=Ephemerocybe angulata TaxID=980116 RepID=A0A8H6HVK2_9AGAR|nr:hypothetical protein DFP72DRAFT_425776 [Tulosesus angulatus]